MALFAELYDHLFKYPDEHLIEHLVKKNNGPMIDLGCATGRTLRFALRNNIKAIGVDSDPEMISIAKKKLDREYKGIFELIESDMREIVACEKCNVVLCTAGTLALQHDPNDRELTLKNMVQLLAPNGVAMIWIPNLNSETKREFDQSIECPDGTIKFRGFREDDIQKRIRHIKLEIDFKNRFETFVFQTKLIPKETMIRDLTNVGFSIINIFGEFDLSPINDESTAQIYLLRKQKLMS